MKNPLAKKDQFGKGSPLKVVSRSSNQTFPRGGKSFLLVLLIGGIACLLYALFSGGELPSPVILDEHGNEILAPARQQKLDRELEEIENAEQYALFATANTYYPCFSCPDGAKTIFLNTGEVWKYGTTRKGEGERYPNQNYGAPNLIFITQFVGTTTECLKMEKIKIYNYPLLPEAKRRKVRLFRPPGNTYDN